jgi:hypothetical protein
MANWNSLVELDPRIGTLMRSAVAQVEAGSNEHAVYCAVKPFVDFLVGTSRGSQIVLQDDRRKWRDFDRAFKPILASVPRPITDLDEQRLNSQAARDLVVSEIYAALCAATQRRDAA